METVLGAGIATSFLCSIDNCYLLDCVFNSEMIKFFFFEISQTLSIRLQYQLYKPCLLLTHKRYICFLVQFDRLAFFCVCVVAHFILWSNSLDAHGAFPIKLWPINYLIHFCYVENNEKNILHIHMYYFFSVSCCSFRVTIVCNFDVFHLQMTDLSNALTQTPHT